MNVYKVEMLSSDGCRGIENTIEIIAALTEHDAKKQFVAMHADQIKSLLELSIVEFVVIMLDPIFLQLFEQRPEF